MGYSIVRMEEPTRNGRMDEGDDCHGVEPVGNLSGVRLEKVARARLAITASSGDEDSKLIACVDLIYDDMELRGAMGHTDGG